jgi:hypothetical protein
MTEHTADSTSNDEVLSRIGHMTRALHESLRGLGLDKLIEKAASDIPDARDRLDYVARLSEDAAKRVLDATDAASPAAGQDRRFGRFPVGFLAVAAGQRRGHAGMARAGREDHRRAGRIAQCGRRHQRAT